MVDFWCWPCILWTLLITLGIILHLFWELSTGAIMSLASRDSFIYPFLICITGISFKCFIALVRISKTMLNRSGKSGHSFLGLNFRGIVFSPSFSSVVFKKQIFFFQLKNFLSVSISVCWEFNHKQMLNFIKCPFASVGIVAQVFFCSLLL